MFKKSANGKKSRPPSIPQGLAPSPLASPKHGLHFHALCKVVGPHLEYTFTRAAPCVSIKPVPLFVFSWRLALGH